MAFILYDAFSKIRTNVIREIGIGCVQNLIIIDVRIEYLHFRLILSLARMIFIYNYGEKKTYY